MPTNTKEEEKMQLKAADTEEAEKKTKAVDTESEEEEDDGKGGKKKKKKSGAAGESPKEDTVSAQDANSTTSPNAGVPSTQDVFVPQSNISVSREVHGNDPISAAKGVEDMDLQKSPLFIKLAAFEQSVKDRLDTIMKSVVEQEKINVELKKANEQLQKFYAQPMYKAVSENVAPEQVHQQSISKQIEAGKIRFSG